MFRFHQLNPNKRSPPAFPKNLATVGFVPHLIGELEHPSIICHHQAATTTKTIWLQPHLDTAPVCDRSQWQHDPFAGTIVGDWIYGREVADSKGAIALFICLGKALRDSPQFNGSLFLWGMRGRSPFFG
ncbi:M20/M25/M40 family metallo-hydrolase [Leptolyngbya sp. FACHB-321]|uniref:M20/M25/M40 family metallo-hydrolase n=1 Tax=Leptolyngbya sp. FACHB-321 TaxID=2692807 RepID=UPI0018EF4EE4|nr:M20/M25/M40 family metallo-hydrolase [Leptolyngbya sp. FACHB-321]